MLKRHRADALAEAPDIPPLTQSSHVLGPLSVNLAGRPRQGKIALNTVPPVEHVHTAAGYRQTLQTNY
jgi:hypothetical protein